MQDPPLVFKVSQHVQHAHLTLLSSPLSLMASIHRAPGKRLSAAAASLFLLLSVCHYGALCARSCGVKSPSAVKSAAPAASRAAPHWWPATWYRLSALVYWPCRRDDETFLSRDHQRLDRLLFEVTADSIKHQRNTSRRTWAASHRRRRLKSTLRVLVCAWQIAADWEDD